MNQILIGCPVFDRGWILDEWFKHSYQALINTGLNGGYVFVLDRRSQADLAVIAKYLDVLDIEIVFVKEELTAYKRDWNPSRYEFMVYLRNTLLSKVRELKPDFFLSLDSDILVHPGSINNLIESVDKYNAVGGKLYMSKGRHHPSYAMLKRHGLHRPDCSGIMKVDVIMAMKLMTPSAYNVDYRVHSYGEDIGWSQSCVEEGLMLGWDGRITNRHVMEKKYYGLKDGRTAWCDI